MRAEMDARCRIEMLGGLRVTQGERFIARFPSRKAAALLAYLAYHLNRTHPREVLIALLWPTCDLNAGRNNLSVALSALRQLLEPPAVASGAVIRADRASVRLNPETIRTDVAEFEAALEAAKRSTTPQERADCLTRAAELYRGELLPGWYEDWLPP